MLWSWSSFYKSIGKLSVTDKINTNSILCCECSNMICYFFKQFITFDPTLNFSYLSVNNDQLVFFVIQQRIKLYLTLGGIVNFFTHFNITAEYSEVAATVRLEWKDGKVSDATEEGGLHCVADQNIVYFSNAQVTFFIQVTACNFVFVQTQHY